MKVIVTIEQVNVITREYEVDGVNSLEAAAKCAMRCGQSKFQPNAYCRREVPHRPTFKVTNYEVIN